MVWEVCGFRGFRKPIVGFMFSLEVVAFGSRRASHVDEKMVVPQRLYDSPGMPLCSQPCRRVGGLGFGLAGEGFHEGPPRSAPPPPPCYKQR